MTSPETGTKVGDRGGPVDSESNKLLFASRKPIFFEKCFDAINCPTGKLLEMVNPNKVANFARVSS